MYIKTTLSRAPVVTEIDKLFLTIGLVRHVWNIHDLAQKLRWVIAEINFIVSNYTHSQITKYCQYSV